MKKIIYIFTLCLICASCSCSPRHQAEEIIDKYQEKYELANKQLNEQMVPFSEEEWDYVLRYAYYWANETMITVGENWNLNMNPMKEQRMALAGKAESAKVPLTEDQEKVLHLYTETLMDIAVVKIMEKWLELNK